MILKLLLRLLSVIVVLVGSIAIAISGHLLAGMGLHIMVLSFLLAGTLNPSSRLFGKVQTRSERGIWLTIDDGPDPHDTPIILDMLDYHQAKATFFVIGEKAKRYPELIREIHRRGHQIGNHSWSHPRSIFWCLGPIRIYREIKKCQRVITRIIGESPKVFRAPVGHYNFFVHPILKQFGLRLVGWNCRGFDGVDPSLPDVTRRISKNLTEHSIVLAHEATPIACEVVAYILGVAKENGWPCVIPDASPKLGSY